MRLESGAKEHRSAFVLSFHFLLFFHFFSSGDSTQVHCVDYIFFFQSSPFSQSSFQIDPNSNAYFVANFGFDAADNERVGGGGTGTKPGPKSGKDQAARPLAGAEVLVAVRGPSPGEGGGKNVFGCRKAGSFVA